MLFRSQMSEEHPGHVFLTMGNHELFCLQYIRRELSDFTWRAFGSTDTVEEVNRLNPSETEALAEYIQSLPLYLTIDGAKEGRDGQLLMTHSGFQADYIVREPDGSINVVKTIESSARSDLFKHLVSNDIHYIPRADQLYSGNLGYSAGRILTFLSLLIPAFSLLSTPLLLIGTASLR